MAFLGYALFTGQYGDFTVPVFEIEDFSFPTSSLQGKTLVFTKETYSMVEWNLCENIFNTVLNPPKVNPNSESNLKHFVLNSVPEVDLSAYYYTAKTGAALDSDYIKEIQSWNGNDEWAVGTWVHAPKTVPAIFKIVDEGNKYYLNFSTDVSPGYYSEDIEVGFMFVNIWNNFAIDSVQIQSNPVIIGENPPTHISVENPIQYFYERTHNPNNIPWRDWVDIYLNYSNGNKEKLTVDEIDYSASTTKVRDLNLTDYAAANANIQISYLRDDVISENWHINLSLKSDPNITGAIIYEKIKMLGDAYTPGTGGGTQSSQGGGGGNFGIVNGTPETSEPIEPFLPGIETSSGSVEGSVSNAGLFVHYAMNANMLKIIGDWLWANDLGLIIAKEFLSILYGSPIESAISLMSYPFNVTALPGVVSNQQELFWGAHGAGFNATAITNPYATIDWGTIQLTEFWGNFLDYAPHTKLELYLPWCTGFVPIDPNECLPGTLRVITNIELAKGTCLHNVIGNDGRVIATHAGTCGKQLPLTALDTSGKALALVTGAVGAGLTMGAAASGAMGAALNSGTTPATFKNMAAPGNVRHGLMKNPLDIGSVASGGAKSASKMGAAAKKPALATASAAFRTPISVQRNGSFTGSTAGLGVQFPYLVISRPTQSVPAQYGHHYGYPSNIYTPLANIRGYTEVGEIHLTGFVCTEDELEEIDSILKGGVIL